MSALQAKRVAGALGATALLAFNSIFANPARADGAPADGTSAAISVSAKDQAPDYSPFDWKKDGPLVEAVANKYALGSLIFLNDKAPSPHQYNYGTERAYGADPYLYANNPGRIDTLMRVFNAQDPYFPSDQMAADCKKAGWGTERAKAITMAVVFKVHDPIIKMDEEGNAYAGYGKPDSNVQAFMNSVPNRVSKILSDPDIRNGILETANGFMEKSKGIGLVAHCKQVIGSQSPTDNSMGVRFALAASLIGVPYKYVELPTSNTRVSYVQPNG